MPLFHLLVTLLFLGFGVYNMFVDPVTALHYLVISLFFHLTVFEVKGTPFSRWTYLLAMILLLGDAVLNILVFPTATTWVSGLVSLFFAFLSWQTYRKAKRS